MSKQINTPNAPEAIGPYAQAVQIGNFLFTSGQIGLVPETGVLVHGIEAQTRQVMQNLQHVLEAAGYGWQDVVKTTVFVADLADFVRVNQIYAAYFPSAYPARSCVQVAELPRGARIEIECVAGK